MSDNITPQGYVYGGDPQSIHPFWGEGGGSGATFTPHLEPFSDETGKGNILSWTNDGELPNPDPVKIYDGKDITETEYDWVYLTDLANGTITFAELYERIKELDEKNDSPECGIQFAASMEDTSLSRIRRSIYNTATNTWDWRYDGSVRLIPFSPRTASTGYEGPEDPEDPAHHDIIFLEFNVTLMDPNDPSEFMSNPVKISIDLTDVNGTIRITSATQQVFASNIDLEGLEIIKGWTLQLPQETLDSSSIQPGTFYYELVDYLGVQLPHKETT